VNLCPLRCSKPASVSCVLTGRGFLGWSAAKGFSEPGSVTCMLRQSVVRLRSAIKFGKATSQNTSELDSTAYQFSFEQRHAVSGDCEINLVRRVFNSTFLRGLNLPSLFALFPDGRLGWIHDPHEKIPSPESFPPSTVRVEISSIGFLPSRHPCRHCRSCSSVSWFRFVFAVGQITSEASFRPFAPDLCVTEEETEGLVRPDVPK